MEKPYHDVGRVPEERRLPCRNTRTAVNATTVGDGLTAGDGLMAGDGLTEKPPVGGREKMRSA